MPMTPYMLTVIGEQQNIVLALDSPEVTEAAKKIAFYAAMIDAAEEDPMDDEVEHNEMMEHFRQMFKTNVEAYQKLVNELL